ncbi:MAG: GIY-YIG nuclease family protein [Flavobacteriales bacterium]|nr:GIY-YIG nuclease family protein [Flavobacteriales bacterium]
MKTYYVYILECADLSYYVGVTNNIVRRLKEHNDGISTSSYTSTRLPVKLVYCEQHRYILNAIAREKQIKNWSRIKKIALITSKSNQTWLINEILDLKK